MESKWSKDSPDFKKHLNSKGIAGNEKKLLLKRMEMHAKIGSNQYYEGNGLTKDKISDSRNNYRAVETLNFERAETILDTLISVTDTYS